MRLLLLLLSFCLISNCTKPKTVLICGDHICVNNTEAEQYFEENLIIEVKIINKKSKEETNLIELNLKDNEEKRKVSITKKENTSVNLRELSKDEIIKIKKNIKEKRQVKKITKKIINNNEETDKKIKTKKNINDVENTSSNVSKKRKNVVDICTIIEKCSIDEISKYLLEQAKKKDFPDITTRY